MLENRLVAGLDIDLSTYDLGMIKQPTVRQLVELPFGDSDMLSPFIMIEQYFNQIYDTLDNNEDLMNFSRIDCLNPLEQMSRGIIAEEYEKDKQIYYNDVYIDRRKRYSFFDIYFTMLMLFFDCSEKDITIGVEDSHTIIVIRDKAIINRDNIAILNKIILRFFDIDVKTLSETEDDPWEEQTGSDREKELIKKFKEKEQKRREKNTMHLCDYINIVVHHDNRNYADVLDWTYYQLISTVKIGRLKDNSDIGIKVITTGMSGLSLEDIVDWQKESKLDIDNSIY